MDKTTVIIGALTVAAVGLGMILAPSGKVSESLFAHVQDGVVTQVIVADQSFIDSGAEGPPSEWVRTYYDGSGKGKYANKGDLYDVKQDKFIPPKPSDPRATFDSALDEWVVLQETMATTTH